MNTLRRALLLLALPVGWLPAAQAAPSMIKLVPRESEHKVEVLVDDKPFTVYQWPASVKKPVLFPVRTAGGAVVTRGFPLEPAAGESQDHPHHVGFWFNYGDVGGVDFWGNSGQTKPGSQPRGSIVHRGVTSARGGRGQGQLDVTSEWVDGEGKPMLRESTHLVFGAADGRRSIDRVARLEAASAPVSFGDNKEGMLAVRMASPLELPSKKNPSATGQYRSSEGITGDAVWGTRARWMMLTGKLGGEAVTVALFDHPKNPGFPTHWHARGYGLFAANPLGQKSLGKTEPPSSLTIAKGKPVQFAYRLLILSSTVAPADVEAEYQRFVKEVK
jgi:hypothetical protein